MRGEGYSANSLYYRQKILCSHNLCLAIKRRNLKVKRKVTLCVLVFALLLTCANAMAAKIGNVTAESGTGAQVTPQGDEKSFKVTYTGKKDKEYVVMVVAEAGVDSTNNVPTKTSINNNQNGVVAYMDQVKGNADGKVEFTVRPNLEKANKDAKYFVYVSSNDTEAANNAMKKIGSFVTIEDLIRYLGDVYRDDNANDITILDVQRLLNYVIENVRLTGDDLKAANVDKDENNNITILDVQRLLNMVITNAPKESIS